MRPIPTLTALILSLATLTARAADPVSLTVHAQQPIKKIEVGIYGHFLEHIYNSVHGGLWGDQVLNGTLETPPPPRGRRGGGGGAPGGTSDGAQASVTTTTAPAASANPPRAWTFVGPAGEVRNDTDNPFNAVSSIRIQRATADGAAAIRQQHIALTQGERYTLTFYTRGKGACTVQFLEGETPVFAQPVSVDHPQWQLASVEFNVPRTVNDATLQIALQGAGILNIDQVSLFSATTRANHNLRPDLYKAIADLKPASIRWPGGSFANNYIWQNAIGPVEKRLPHPIEQWNDRDNYHFGTDEFIQMCERLGSEPVLVLNTARGVPDALNWLEYCMGEENTPMGKLRAQNGRRQPYKLNILEIDNEPWLLMPYERYLQVVKDFAPAIRAKYPNLKLSVAGSYAYDTGPGEGNAAWNNANWDPRMIADAAGLFDILSPHYYNGLLREHAPDYKEDPRKYGEFLQTRADLIKKSANPNIKFYVSEWNLTHGAWGNDWRVGLYAGAILNEFERRADIVAMACPALWLRKSVTRSWDNALINFDQSRWFPAGNYLVNKLWRDAYAPGLLAVDGPDRPLNIVAAKTEDSSTLYLKIVNPDSTPTDATFTLDGFPAANATLQLIAPGSETAKNTLDTPTALKVTEAPVTTTANTLKVTMPPFSAGVIKVTK